jgi:site-specific DNA recombinase
MSRKTTHDRLATAKRAWAYLRVSTDHQVRTDYSEDGLSLAAQREAARDKAAQLEAEITAEFSDPGRSAYVDLHKRTGFLTMLEELKQANADPATRVDYVIVWALNRWARNTVDHWQTREIIRKAGARLVSITEPLAGEDTATAFLYESMIASYNQYQSMQTGENVTRGLRQKASVGGTYGPAPLGYLNTVDQLPDGRRVAVSTIDPKRGHFITLAFQLYASGEYSLSQLAEELERLGLRSRPSKRWPTPVPLGSSVLQRLLRRRYYIGEIVYKRGTADEMIVEGRHEALIDRETFDRVQTLLDEKQLAGERPQTRQHYLRGSVFCDECGRRLGYALSTGKNGKRYAYYFCLSRISRNPCAQRINIRPELIEDAISEYYGTRPIAMTPERIQKSKEAIRALAAVSQEALQQVQQAKTVLIDKLTAQQQRLLRMHAEEGDDVSPDAFRAERARLQSEIAAAQQSVEETSARLQLESRDLEMALELVDDIRGVYLAADEQTRRGYNQAFFNKLRIRAVWSDDQTQQLVSVGAAELTEPYAVLLSEGLAEGIEAEVAALSSAESPDELRRQLSGALSFSRVSYFELMAEREGFEPSMDETAHTGFRDRRRPADSPLLPGSQPRVESRMESLVTGPHARHAFRLGIARASSVPARCPQAACACTASA